MLLRLVCFGKVKKNLLTEINDFTKRFPKGVFETLELKESTHKNPEQKLLEEMIFFHKKIGDPGFLILLDERGEMLRSKSLSDKIFNLWSQRSNCLTFLIGSSYGIHSDLKKKADFQLALTPMTLTHDHARLILIEQLYRAQCIRENHPYHHD